jgi:hypothetical protein
VKLDIESGRISFYEYKFFFFENRFAPCLARLSVAEDRPNGSTLWRLTSKGAPCRVVENITLGTAPPGFESTGGLPESARITITAVDGSEIYGISRSYQWDGFE